VEPVLPPLLPAHIYAQQVMALTLQEGGITRPDLETWLADAAACVSAEVRDAVLRHMLSVGVLTEDESVIGLGAKGEREFGRRHFSDLVAAFSSQLILTVFNGPAELGSVHPASLARQPGDAAPILLLGGRSWRGRGRRLASAARGGHLRRGRRAIALARHRPHAPLRNLSWAGGDYRWGRGRLSPFSPSR
jgi:ATP-dependent Lhr-like helicase